MEPVDQCKHCTLRCDYDNCVKESCQQHNSWFAKEQAKRIAELEAANRELKPYYDAVRKAHNGYNPECQKEWGCQEPESPAAAIADLLYELDEINNTAIDYLAAGFDAAEDRADQLAVVADALAVEIDDADPIYCPVCGSCGEAGCCPPDQCTTVQGLYCDSNVKEYRDLLDENAMLREALDEITCQGEGPVTGE